MRNDLNAGSASDCHQWLRGPKTRVVQLQLKSALELDTELLQFCWELRAHTVSPSICKSKFNEVVEYSLSDTSNSLGLVTSQLSNALPVKLHRQFHSIEALESTLLGVRNE